MWGLASGEHVGLHLSFPSGRIDRAPSTTNFHHHFHHCSCWYSIHCALQITTVRWIKCRFGSFV
jgi:hypothetical protein